MPLLRGREDRFRPHPAGGSTGGPSRPRRRLHRQGHLVVQKTRVGHVAGSENSLEKMVAARVYRTRGLDLEILQKNGSGHGLDTGAVGRARVLAAIEAGRADGSLNESEADWLRYVVEDIAW